MPRRRGPQRKKVKEAIRTFHNEKGFLPTVPLIANNTGLNRRKVERALRKPKHHSLPLNPEEVHPQGPEMSHNELSVYSFLKHHRKEHGEPAGIAELREALQAPKGIKPLRLDFILNSLEKKVGKKELGRIYRKTEKKHWPRYEELESRESRDILQNQRWYSQTREGE